MSTRFISFAGSALAIKYKGTRPAKIVNFLYQYLPTNDKVLPYLIYHLLPEEEPENLILYRDEALVYTGNNEGTVAELLLGDTCYHLADRSQSGLLLTAAGI